MRRMAMVVGLVVLGVFAYRYLISGPTPKHMNLRRGDAIICFGDSLTAGTGAGSGMDYPNQLARMIGRPVINAGVPGDTTAEGLSRLDRDVLARSPGIVLVTLGGNDLKNGADNETFSQNLRTFVTRIQAAGALVVLGGIEMPLRERGFGETYRQVAGEMGALLLPNIYQGILGRPELMSDPIHPNGEGYTVMAERFSRAIRPYL